MASRLSEPLAFGASTTALRSVETAIRHQLQPGSAGEETMLDRYDAQRQRLREAASPSQSRAELARLGGVVKAWRRFLVQSITEGAIGSTRPGREKVRQWQQAWFDQALASSELRQYAREDRSGGGRGEKIALPRELNEACAALYGHYKNALKRPPGAAGPADARYPRPE